MVNLPRHKQSQLSHPLCALAWPVLRPLGNLSLACAVAVILVKFLLPALPLLLQPLDDINGPADVHVSILG